jgi:hypothetical protein
MTPSAKKVRPARIAIPKNRGNVEVRGTDGE